MPRPSRGPHGGGGEWDPPGRTSGRLNPSLLGPPYGPQAEEAYMGHPMGPMPTPLPVEMDTSSDSQSSSDHDSPGLDASRATRPSRPPRPPRARCQAGGLPGNTPAQEDLSGSTSVGGSSSSTTAGSSRSTSVVAEVPPNTDRSSLAKPVVHRAPPVENIRGVVQAVGVVLQEMLQMKYGLVLDSADFVRKVERYCRGPAGTGENHRTEFSGASLTPFELVSQMNARHELRFQARHAGNMSFSMRIETRQLLSYEDVRCEVQKMIGTPRIVATVCGLDASDCCTSHAIAVLREDYARSGLLVGRGSVPSVPPLVVFNPTGLRDAIVLEPRITAVYPRVPRHSGGGHSGQPDQVSKFGVSGGDAETAPHPPGPEAPLPRLREEYLHLGVWLVPDTPRTPQASPARGWEAPQSRSRFEPCRSQPAKPVDPRRLMPTQRWMWDFRTALQEPDAVTDSLVAAMQQLIGWLGDCDEVSSLAKRGLASANLYAEIVDTLRRAGTSGGHRRTELAVAAHACQVIGLCVQHNEEGATAFIAAGAVPSLCGLMRRWLTNGEIQSRALFAMRRLIEEDVDSTMRAFPEGASQLVVASLAAHPGLPELQKNGTRTAQLLMAQAEESSTVSGLGLRQRSAAPPIVGGAAGAGSVQAGHDDNGVRERTPPVSDEGFNNGRKDMATKLLERRAANAAKPGVLKVALGWFFNGAQQENSSPMDWLFAGAGEREGAQEQASAGMCGSAPAPLPVSIQSAQSSAPTVLVPPAVPRLDLFGRAGGGAGSSASGGVAEAGVAARPHGGLQVSALGSPMAQQAELDALDPMDAASEQALDTPCFLGAASPHTPPAVRWQGSRLLDFQQASSIGSLLDGSLLSERRERSDVSPEPRPAQEGGAAVPVSAVSHQKVFREVEPADQHLFGVRPLSHVAAVTAGDPS